MRVVQWRSLLVASACRRRSPSTALRYVVPGRSLLCASTDLTAACTVDDRRIVPCEALEILPAAVPVGHHGRVLVPVHVDLQRGSAPAVHIHHRPHHSRFAGKVEIHQVRSHPLLPLNVSVLPLPKLTSLGCVLALVRGC